MDVTILYMKWGFTMFSSVIRLGVGACIITSALWAQTKQNVVYHMNTGDAKIQSATLRNIQNHIDAEGKDNLNIKVMMHGDGVSMVNIPEPNKTPKIPANADMNMQSKIMDLKNQGVQFLVCNITLKRNDIKPEQLYDVEPSDLVPIGVANLAKLQAQGFAYIKP